MIRRDVLRELHSGLWLADGPTVRFLGFIPYSTRMAVVRLADGALWVWSPIELSDSLERELDGLGPVRHLVAPNPLHHLFLGEWLVRYPGARIIAAPGVAKKRPDLPIAAELGAEPDPAWAGEIDQVIVSGSFLFDEVVFFHRASSTALVTDLIQRFEPEQLGWLAPFMRLWGLVGERGSTPREWRASFLRRGAARAARDRMLAWSPRRLVVAHGTCALENGREAIATGLRWL